MGRNVAFNRVARAAGLAALAAAAVAVSGCTNAGSEETSNAVAGKQLFVKKCGSCHVLGRAGTKGTAGPNLDDAFAVARQEGWGDNSVRGVVLGQILSPSKGAMPAKLVEGEDAEDVAAYVAAVAAKRGKDAGILATAVEAAGSGEPAVAEGGVLSIAADPGGQLAYVTKAAQAPPGPIELQMPNESGVPHNIVVEGNGVKIESPVVDKGVAKASGTLNAGDYAFYCSVPGHREGGMEGKLTVE